MTINIALPISHHFNKKKNVKILQENRLYDFLEVRPSQIEYNEEIEKQTTFHADNIQPIHELKESEFDFIQKISDTKPDLEIISFHCAFACDKIYHEGVVAHPSSRVYKRDEMYLNAERNIKIIKNILGDRVAIAIENNNYYPSEAYKSVCEPSFLTDLVLDNEINFLFDNAHARVSSHNMGINYEEYRESLPLDRTVQIQFCQPTIPKESQEIAVDSHGLPDESNIREVLDLARKFNIKYVTPEYYKDFEKLAVLLKKLKSIKNT